MARIFISYRRDDAKYPASQLHRALGQYVRNPSADIFIDIDNIPAGVDFVEHLDATVAKCEVLLAVIGPGWLEARNPETGQRRLEDPSDFVRIEIASALRRNIPVVPVLLDGTPIPKAEQLPEDLKPLARRNGVPVQLTSFDSDVARLVDRLPIDLTNQPRAKVALAASSQSVRRGLFLAALAAASVGLGAIVLDHFRWFGEGAKTESVQPAIQAPPPSIASTEHLDELVEETARAAQAEAALTAPVTAQPNETAATEPQTKSRGTSRAVGETFRDSFQIGSRKGPELVVLPPGSFVRGAPSDEKHERAQPQGTVRIGYLLAVGKYEVTWAEWDECFADGGCGNDKRRDYDWGRGSRPAIDVSWDDAKAYVAWLSEKTGHQYRLLTEAEWEYAARAGSTTPFSFGESITYSQANFKDTFPMPWPDNAPLGWVEPEKPEQAYRAKTVPVGSYPANAFGLFDMHGNVQEWVEDCFEEGYFHQPTDGSAYTTDPCVFRVLRGGSWQDTYHILRSYNRGIGEHGSKNHFTGFRVARMLTE